MLAGGTLAGCLGDENGEPTEPVEAWYGAWREDDTDRMASLIHSRSNFTVDDRGATVDEPPESVDPTIADSNPSKEDFTQRASGWLDQEAISAVFDEEDTALVAVFEADITHVLATDDGAWKLIR